MRRARANKSVRELVLELKQFAFLVILLAVIVLFSSFTALTYWVTNLLNKSQTVEQSGLTEIIEEVSPEEIVRVDTAKKQIILTFDGGDDIESAENILNVLKKHNLVGTFFLTGVFIERYPELVRRIGAENHEIYNHTYSHPYLTALPDAEVINELDKMQIVLESITNRKSRPYFRAPYGDRDSRVINLAARHGYRSVFWTYDALDWKEDEGMTAEQVRNFILNTASAGNIYLMHIGDAITGLILDDVITKLQSQGYEFRSLGQSLSAGLP